MSIVNGKQPSVRFDLGGPYAHAGVSFVPKVICFKKEGIAGTANYDFIALPAETFISEAFIQSDTAVNNTGVVTLGTDGDPDALITSTAFDAGTDGNSASFKTGLYLHAGDTLRLATTGTATAGAVSGFIVYYELAAMKSEGIHFTL